MKRVLTNRQIGIYSARKDEQEGRGQDQAVALYDAIKAINPRPFICEDVRKFLSGKKSK
jgi:hypothetical protein